MLLKKEWEAVGGWEASYVEREGRRWGLGTYKGISPSLAPAQAQAGVSFADWAL